MNHDGSVAGRARAHRPGRRHRGRRGQVPDLRSGLPGVRRRAGGRVPDGAARAWPPSASCWTATSCRAPPGPSCATHAGRARASTSSPRPSTSRSLDLVCELGVAGAEARLGRADQPAAAAARCAARGLPVHLLDRHGHPAEVGDAVAWLDGAPGVAAAALRLELPDAGRAGQPAGDRDDARDVRPARRLVRPHRRARCRRWPPWPSAPAVLEKHVTLDTTRPGPDHAASADAAPSATTSSRSRAAQAALGTGVKAPAPAEPDNIPLVRRSWHAARDLRTGARLEDADVVLLRPAQVSPRPSSSAGRVVARDVARGQPLRGRRPRAGRPVTRRRAHRGSWCSRPPGPTLPARPGAPRARRGPRPRRSPCWPPGRTANRDFGDPLADLDLDGVDVEHVAADLGSAGFRRRPPAASASPMAIAAAARTRRARRRAVVLGDRWELLYAVPPIVLAGVPLVHLHGGEVTEGAIDDRIRHAVTKLADLHCVSTEAAAARLRQLGEPAERMFVTGAPSLDRVAAVRPAGDATLERHPRPPGAPSLRPRDLSPADGRRARGRRGRPRPCWPRSPRRPGRR